MYFFASSKRCRQPLAVQHRGLCLPPKKLVLGPVQGVSSYEDLCPARQGPAERGWIIANCQLGASFLLPQAEAGSQPHAAQEGAGGCHERCCESPGELLAPGILLGTQRPGLLGVTGQLFLLSGVSKYVTCCSEVMQLIRFLVLSVLLPELIVI